MQRSDVAPWLVLVHGVSQDSRLFSGQLEAFSHKYRLLLVDLPGHGRSSELPGPYGPVEYARAVACALSWAGVNQFHFWGTHTGSSVGLLLALGNPSQLLSLVLEAAVVPGNPMPYVERRLRRAKITAATSGVGAAIREWYQSADWFHAIHADPVARRSAEHWQFVSEFSGAPWIDDRAAASMLPIRKALRSLTVPTLLVNGEHDHPEFIAVADILAADLQEVSRVTIPAAGGFPLWEDPDVVNEVVLEFLARVDRPWTDI